MRFYILVVFLVLFISSCQNQQKVSGQNFEPIGNIVSNTPESASRKEELIESFSDNSNIGLLKRNKIEVFNYKKSDGNVFNNHRVEIKFYALSESKEWQLKQRFEFEKDDLLDCDPNIEDFNNDGYKDFTYVSLAAARSANEVRKLFIYDKSKDELIYIKNSEDCPNMLYNKELDCIDSWAFHGGTSTSFLRIENDLLKEIASVHSGGTDEGVLERTVYVIDKNGKERLVRKDKITEDDIYVRYKSYNPPIPYESSELEN